MGINIELNMRYKLDISSMPNQASNIIAQLKDKGITTVICACDPVMLALGLTPKANEQSYEPEWVTAGLAFVDQDIVSQLIDSRQWSHAFGIAYNAESEPQGRSFPYAAYKQMRPDDEPAFGVEEIYYQMYMLAIGIQIAGPSYAADLRGRHVRLPRGYRAPGPVGLRGGRPHAHRRLPRDLVGCRSASPGRTTSPARGCSSTRPALDPRDPADRSRRLLPGGLTWPSHPNRSLSQNGHLSHNGHLPDDGSVSAPAGHIARVSAHPAGERAPLPRLRPPWSGSSSSC